MAVRGGIWPEVLVVRCQAGLERPWPAEPLKPRRDLKEIQVRIIAAAGADELIRAGIAAFWTAIYDADRPAPQDSRPAVPGLTGKRECHDIIRPHTQPRVTMIVRARCGGSAWTDR